MTILKAYREDRKLRRAYSRTLPQSPDYDVLNDPIAMSNFDLIGSQVAEKYNISVKELDDFVDYAINRWTTNFITYLNLNEK